MPNLFIKFRKKFTQGFLNKMVEDYWEKSKSVSVNETIFFDLQETEWIATEELTFLFGWIRYLKGLNKTIDIIYPINERVKRLIVEESFYEDSIEGNYHKVIPFTAIKIRNLEELQSSNDVLEYELSPIFKLDEKINDLLSKYSITTPFENKTLSHIITSELYLNSVYHAFDKDFRGNKECYMAISCTSNFTIEKEIFKENRKKYEVLKLKGINLGYSGTALKKFIDDNFVPFTEREAQLKIGQYIDTTLKYGYESERSPETLNFFIDRETGKYRNESFVEFTFLDFGEGIPQTFKKAINKGRIKTLSGNSTNEKVKEIIENRKDELNDNCTLQNFDTQLLEYAFLLSASSNPFDESLEIHSTVPRGLYFLVDIVKRFNGLVIARSNRGKVVFDFSSYHSEIKNSIFYSQKDANLPYFQGTLITIIFPPLSKKFKMGAISPPKFSINKSPKKYEYISVKKIYEQVELEDTNIEKFSNSNIDIQQKTYYLTFKGLNEKLDSFRNESCVLLIDFWGVSISRQVAHKLLYYFSTTPKINENVNAIVFNFKEVDLIKDVQNSIIEAKNWNNIVNIYRPIPYIIRFNILSKRNEIIWVGVTSTVHESHLSELLRDCYQVKSDMDFEITGKSDTIYGNFIVKSSSKNIVSSIKSIEEIYDIYEEISEKEVTDILIRDSTKSNEKEIFLTAGGYYQKEFISLYEELYENSDYLDFIAVRFLSKYKKKIGSSLNVDSILSVTLSSQLIAKAICIAIKREIKDEKNINVKVPKLIRLASYYSFDKEDAFNNIKEGEKVLVVNDVISTGSLLCNIIDSLGRKEAIVDSIFTVVDTRKKTQELITFEKKSNFLDEIFEKDKLIVFKHQPITKFTKSPTDGLINRNINPIINSIIDTNIKNSEDDKVIYEDCRDILNEINEEYFKIGHFRHNNVHHSYFIKTDEIFSSITGANLLQKLGEKIYHSESQYLSESTQNTYKSKDDLSYKIELISKQLESLKNNDSRKYLQKEYFIIEKELNLIRESVKKTPNRTNKIDYIYYPSYSGAESIEENQLAKVFDLPLENVKVLYRFDTSKGWRFPLPPKKWNEPSKNKTILIIDDGSCTGETIVQMIDSICFLDVAKIIVLSVFGRLEDFQREFFSRIRNMKVKRLKSKEEKRDPNNYLIDPHYNEHIAPVHIYFGTNLHIPVYPSHKSCDLCKESADLSEILKIDELPEFGQKYINRRIKELKLINTFEINNFHELTFLPKVKNKSANLSKLLFEIRDKIGKIETYRFYRSYYDDWHNLLRGKRKQEIIELVIAVVLHEKKLLEVVKNQLPEVFIATKTFILDYINHGFKIDTVFKWKIESLLRFYALLDADFSEDERFYNLMILNRIFHNLTDKDTDSYEFLSYSIFNWNEKFNRDILILDLWRLFKSESDDNISKKVLRELIKSRKEQKSNNFIHSLFNLHFYFAKTESYPRHVYIDNLITDLSGTLLETAVDFKKEIFIRDAENILNLIYNKVIIYLQKLNSNNFLENYYPIVYNNFFGKGSIYDEFTRLKNIINLEKNNGQISQVKKDQISDKMLNFSRNYFTKNNSFVESLSTFGLILSIKKVVSDAIKNIKVETFFNSFNITNHEPIFGNKDALKECIENIVRNIENFQTAKKVNISCEFFIQYSENDRNIELKIIQNHPFESENFTKGHGIDLIEKTCEKYGWDFLIADVTLKPNFIFTFTLFDELKNKINDDESEE